jgi:hypothetical protein
MKHHIPFHDAAFERQASARYLTLEALLAAAVLVVGLAAGIAVLGRGIWLDEFAEIYTSRYGSSFWDFLQNLSEDIHPLLHYLILYLAKQFGITDIKFLRLLNILGVPLVLWSLWWAWKQEKKAATPGTAPGLIASQAFAILALYASSALFLNYFAEARCYFLGISASIATALVWRVLMMREGWEGGAGWRYLAWGLSLAILVNLHYFATFFGGLLTIALLIRHVALGKWGRALAIALISALAASPSLVMGTFQLLRQLEVEFNNTAWVTTTSREALSIYLDVLYGAAGYNIAAGVAILVAALAVLKRRRQRRIGASWQGQGAATELPSLLTGRDAILLLVTAAFFGILFVANIWNPLIIDRYLFAGCGPITVLIGLAAAGPSAPRLAVPAICIFALVLQVRGARDGDFDRPGWAASAAAVADAIKACPDTKVYAYPFWDEARFGQTYYAERYGFSFTAVAAGDSVPRQDKCPNIVWIEHADELFNASTYALVQENVRVEEILEKLKLSVAGTPEAEFVESGLLIFVR